MSHRDLLQSFAPLLADASTKTTNHKFFHDPAHCGTHTLLQFIPPTSIVKVLFIPNITEPLAQIVTWLQDPSDITLIVTAESSLEATSAAASIFIPLQPLHSLSHDGNTITQ